MIDLPDVSLVCVETRFPELAIYAIERCLAQARFGQCRLLTPLKVQHPGIETVSIDAIDGIEAYSSFMLRQLGRFFDRRHVLIVQWDGFVVDAAAWRDEFLQFDYLGAPWPHRDQRVGNGGFSLRSRRLVDALERMSVRPRHPEDEQICIDLAPTLARDYGISIAPYALARRFAYERSLPDRPTFGFHGFFNFHRVLDEGEMVDYLARCGDAILQSPMARGLLKNLYRSGQYEAANAIARRRLRGPVQQRMDAVRLLLRSSAHAWLHSARRP